MIRGGGEEHIDGFVLQDLKNNRFQKNQIDDAKHESLNMRSPPCQLLTFHDRCNIENCLRISSQAK